MAERVRADMVWQQSGVAEAYHDSRTGIPFADAHFEIMHRVLDSAGIPVRNVLDLGAGDGIATATVAERHPVEQAMLVDFSEPMLDQARRRFSTGEPAIVAGFVAGDFRETAWHNEVTAVGPYDAVISRFAIHHIPDEAKAALFRTVLGWLVPGGMFINIEHVKSASCLYAEAHDQLMIDGIVAMRGDRADADEIAARYHARQDAGANILAAVEAQLEWLREAGFTDVDCVFKAFELAVFSGRRPVNT